MKHPIHNDHSDSLIVLYKMLLQRYRQLIFEAYITGVFAGIAVGIAAVIIGVAIT